LKFDNKSVISQSSACDTCNKIMMEALPVPDSSDAR